MGAATAGGDMLRVPEQQKERSKEKE